MDGGGGGGCPVLTFAIKRELYEDDGDAAVAALKQRIANAKAAQKKKGKLSLEDANLADIDDDTED